MNLDDRVKGPPRLHYTVTLARETARGIESEIMKGLVSGNPGQIMHRVAEPNSSGVRAC